LKKIWFKKYPCIPVADLASVILEHQYLAYALQQEDLAVSLYNCKVKKLITPHQL
jgi:hypothetical protein